MVRVERQYSPITPCCKVKPNSKLCLSFYGERGGMLLAYWSLGVLVLLLSQAEMVFILESCIFVLYNHSFTDHQFSIPYGTI